MGETALDDRGRLTVPKRYRDRYGTKFHLVPLHDGIKLVPLADDPLAALRSEFERSDTDASELLEEARKRAIEEAGR